MHYVEHLFDKWADDRKLFIYDSDSKKSIGDDKWKITIKMCYDIRRYNINPEVAVLGTDFEGKGVEAFTLAAIYIKNRFPLEIVPTELLEAIRDGGHIDEISLTEEERKLLGI